MTEELPEVLNGQKSRYRLERLVFRGSHAQIWLAKSEKGNLVAIKKRDSQSGYPPERWKAERELLERLEVLGIPGVIGLVDQVPWGGEQALVFPWYPLTLSTLSGASWGKLAPILASLAKTLRLIHQAGVIHRDLSLENILLETPVGPPVLADFGLAVVLRNGLAVNEAYPIGGTPAYALSKGKEPDLLEDWHGLAVCAWKLLVGDFPRDKTSQSLCRREALAAGIPVGLAKDLAAWVVENPDPARVEKWLRGQGRVSLVDGPKAVPWFGRWGALGLYIFLILLLFVISKYL